MPLFRWKIKTWLFYLLDCPLVVNFLMKIKYRKIWKSFFYDFLLRRWKIVKFEMGLHNWEMNGNAFNGKIIIRRHWRHLVTEFIPWEIRQLSKSGQDNVKNWIQNYFRWITWKLALALFLHIFYDFNSSVAFCNNLPGGIDREEHETLKILWFR